MNGSRRKRFAGIMALFHGKYFALNPTMPLIHEVALPHTVHATLQTSMRKFFSLPMAAVWEILGKTISAYQQSQDFHVHAAVLMSNHVHLLLTSPVDETEQLLDSLARKLAFQVRLKLGPPGLQFGLYPHSYKILNPVYFSRAFKYIYRNPVCAGLCKRVEEYPYSSITAWLGSTPLRFPLHETYFSQLMIPTNSAELLHWLNTPSQAS